MKACLLGLYVSSSEQLVVCEGLPVDLQVKVVTCLIVCDGIPLWVVHFSFRADCV